MKPLLVGECNPLGADPRAALLPWPRGRSGDRLARILGLTDAEYLREYDRANLCSGRFTLEAARRAATVILATETKRSAIVLLGSRVAAAFCLPYAPFRFSTTFYPPAIALLPHPSGLNRAWNEDGAAERARRCVGEAIALRGVSLGFRERLSVAEVTA